ncbi:hypothetical protein AG1IA_03851 [Rhizoctonia solani AG-1 IA]|uniref:Uncharacterized protein n=1 Tax=Thanatephorus cucumeris (strain AG1-IA) TaxID=983506 RepID=L8WZB2_THACA|nr:hypothetical protein AG1IA_03851 [Rhizoctonia solani AG-1 IA]
MNHSSSSSSSSSIALPLNPCRPACKFPLRPANVAGATSEITSVVGGWLTAGGRPKLFCNGDNRVGRFWVFTRSPLDDPSLVLCPNPPKNSSSSVQSSSSSGLSDGRPVNTSRRPALGGSLSRALPVGLDIEDEGPDQPGGSIPHDFFQVDLAILE